MRPLLMRPTSDTHAPDTLIRKVLYQLTDDLHETIGIDTIIAKGLKNTIDEIMDARDTKVLKAALDSFGDIAMEGWNAIFGMY